MATSEAASPTTQENGELLECDYLVVGAGTAGMSFVDTLITENPLATVILVDRNSKPGGHWNHAYPYVKLHQPSCFYGVNSLQLGKTLNPKNGNEMWDVHDRATGAEVLEYFQTACDNFVATGRVRCFFHAEYQPPNSETNPNSNHSTIVVNSSTVGSNVIRKTYKVSCRKLVTVGTKLIVPSMRKPLIPVYESVDFVPPNQIPSCVQKGKYTNYIVFGNGKSGMDAIVQLVRGEGIDPSQITWVLGRDVWFILREGMADYLDTFRVFGRMESASTINEAYLELEAGGLLGRLSDPNRAEFPSVFKSAIEDQDELNAIRSIKNLIRRGRASSIESNKVNFENKSSIPLEFNPETTLLVDCMVDNLYGYDFPEDFRIFEKGKINLGPMIGYYNPSLSSAMIAFLECCIGRDTNRKETKPAGDDDESLVARKNGYCYFLRGKYAKAKPEAMIGAYYMQIKSFQVFTKLKGGTKFLMGSRTFDGSPMHHKGGLWKFLWALYGPQQLHKIEANLVRQVESKAFSDMDHCFGIESLKEDKEDPKIPSRKQKGKANESRGWARCFQGCFRHSGKTLEREEASVAHKSYC